MMTQEESKILLGKISETMKAGLAKVYEDARRDDTWRSLKKPGEVQIIN